MNKFKDIVLVLVNLTDVQRETHKLTMQCYMATVKMEAKGKHNETQKKEHHVNL